VVRASRRRLPTNWLADEEREVGVLVHDGVLETPSDGQRSRGNSQADLGVMALGGVEEKTSDDRGAGADPAERR